MPDLRERCRAARRRRAASANRASRARDAPPRSSCSSRIMRSYSMSAIVGLVEHVVAVVRIVDALAKLRGARGEVVRVGFSAHRDGSVPARRDVYRLGVAAWRRRERVQTVVAARRRRRIRRWRRKPGPRFRIRTRRSTTTARSSPRRGPRCTPAIRSRFRTRSASRRCSRRIRSSARMRPRSRRRCRMRGAHSIAAISKRPTTPASR